MVGTHRIEGLHGGEKIAGDQLCSLMDQLIEGVLTVSARFSPNDWSGAPSDGFTIPIHALAVAFHVALLEVSGKAVKILVVGQNGVRLGVVEIVVPDAE